jgi:hypothetical protein
MNRACTTAGSWLSWGSPRDGSGKGFGDRYRESRMQTTKGPKVLGSGSIPDMSTETWITNNEQP